MSSPGELAVEGCTSVSIDIVCLPTESNRPAFVLRKSTHAPPPAHRRVGVVCRSVLPCPAALPAATDRTGVTVRGAGGAAAVTPRRGVMVRKGGGPRRTEGGVPAMATTAASSCTGVDVRTGKLKTGDLFSRSIRVASC